MPPFLMSIILFLFAAAFILMMILRVQLSWGPQLLSERRNSRKFRALHSSVRRKTLGDYLPGRHDYAKKLRKLPKTLEELDVSYTDITKLPPLPRGLKKLTAINCKFLNSIEDLPDSLEEIHISECPMLEYVPRLPAKLRTIIMWGTAVRAIQHIPDGVEELDLRCNEWLADLPSQWPQFQPRPYGGDGKLHWINLCGCPAARTIAGNLPAATLREIHDEGVSGWRFNRLRGGIQHANLPFEPEPFVIG